MGELSKTIGEYGENLVEKFFICCRVESFTKRY